MTMQCNLWVEKYRPKRVKDLVLPTHFRNYFDKIIENKDIQNMLLYSATPGTGKTTIAKAIVNDLQADNMYINASTAGIDVLRTQIAEFAMTKSFNRQVKVVILDEADGLTPQFQSALRAFIEEYSKSCRFILTCNYITKIIPALREGRTQEFNFNMNKKEYREELKAQMLKRVIGILKNENVTFDKTVLEQLIDAYMPSMRTILATLQKYASIYGTIDAGINEFKNVDSALVDLIRQHDITGARALIQQNGYSYTDVIKNLFENLTPLMTKKSQAIVTLAQYEYQCSFSNQPELQLTAMMIELLGML